MKNEHDIGYVKSLIVGMRQAYAKGENVMAFARKMLAGADGVGGNEVIATLIAYDLQAGTYVQHARQNSKFNREWCLQLAGILSPIAGNGSSMLEVGCGEATTLAGVLGALEGRGVAEALGFDVSWSRVHVGRNWLSEKQVAGNLFVADLFAIPLKSNAVDIVYTSHSLEPNGGREVAALQEILRVSRRWVVLIEPAYELASDAAKARMEQHGYVRGLTEAAKRCGAEVVEHRLLEVTDNPMNPSGLWVLKKSNTTEAEVSTTSKWRCPLTGAALVDRGDVYLSEETGIIYPVVRGIPMLRPEHAIVASGCV